MDLRGAVTIVTGSATGVGAAAARLLAGKGCNVVINYTRSEAEARRDDVCRDRAPAVANQHERPVRTCSLHGFMNSAEYRLRFGPPH